MARNLDILYSSYFERKPADELTLKTHLFCYFLRSILVKNFLTLSPGNHDNNVILITVSSSLYLYIV